jgi:hypothetical protein
MTGYETGAVKPSIGSGFAPPRTQIATRLAGCAVRRRVQRGCEACQFRRCIAPQAYTHAQPTSRLRARQQTWRNRRRAALLLCTGIDAHIALKRLLACCNEKQGYGGFFPPYPACHRCLLCYQVAASTVDHVLPRSAHARRDQVRRCGEPFGRSLQSARRSDGWPGSPQARIS